MGGLSPIRNWRWNRQADREFLENNDRRSGDLAEGREASSDDRS